MGIYSDSRGETVVLGFGYVMGFGVPWICCNIRYRRRLNPAQLYRIGPIRVIMQKVIMVLLALSVIYSDAEKSFSTAVYIIHYITQPKV